MAGCTATEGIQHSYCRQLYASTAWPVGAVIKWAAGLASTAASHADWHWKAGRQPTLSPLSASWQWSLRREVQRASSASSREGALSRETAGRQWRQSGSPETRKMTIPGGNLVILMSLLNFKKKQAASLAIKGSCGLAWPVK